MRLLWLSVATAFYISSQVSCLEESDLLSLAPDELCKDRVSDEYFRLKADSDGGDCRDVVR